VFRRRQVKNHTSLMRDELGESFGHLRMAAAHAADGAAGALAPSVNAARKAVRSGKGTASDGMESLLSAARSASKSGSRDAKRMAHKGKAKLTKKETGMSGRRWPMMIGGLLAAGAAIGAASALIRRRRSQQSWEEYGSSPTTRDNHSPIDAMKSTMDAGVDKVSAAATAAKERASDLIGSGKSGNSGPSGIDKTASSAGKTSSSIGMADSASSSGNRGEFSSSPSSMAKNTRP
jgi:hypothetical protein